MNLPEKTQRPQLVDTSAIPGWGVDADPKNDPTWPIRDRSQERGLARQWDRPPVQRPQVEILQSIEHTRQPAVVGTSIPPRGISGALRRAAFRWSESNWLHWLTLMGADRINVVEGLVDDLAHGRIPNVPAEMGIRSELAFNKRGLAGKAAIAGLATALAVVLLTRGRGATGRARA